MNRPTVWMLAAAALLAGCSGRVSRHASDTAGCAATDTVGRGAADITSEALAWADSVRATMTLEEKAAQLLLPSLYASGDPYTLARVREYGEMGVGGIVLLKGDCAGASAISDTLFASSAVPPFVSIDAEWGLGMRLEDAPRFPANGNISDTADERLMYDYGREVADECRRLGIGMVLGPVVDLTGGGIPGRRSLGDDPHRVADLSIAYARGLESGGVIGVAKHFPGHGAAAADSHLRKGVIERSLHQLDSLDLYPFRNWIEQGLSGILVGHLALPSIDSGMLPAAVSRTVIHDLLREDLGFRGLVLTDAMNMGGAEGFGADAAVEAGADLVVAPRDTHKALAGVTEAVRQGRITMDDLDDRVRRILFYKYLFALPRERADMSGGIVSERADSIAGGLRR